MVDLDTNSFKEFKMITTTLNKIKSHGPCKPSWNTLLSSLNKTEADDEILPLSHILDSNGFDDVCWVIETLEEEDLRKIRSYLCDVAELALANIHPSGHTLPKRLLEVSRMRISGECDTGAVLRIRTQFTPHSPQSDLALPIIRASIASWGSATAVATITPVLVYSVGVEGVSYNERIELFLKAIN